VRRAGISAFGFGKTNVHVIVSERPEEARRPVDREAAPAAIAEADKIYAWHPPASPAWQSSSGLLGLETLTSELLDEA
jgi:acyl transferase domain-containing protein